MLHLNIDNAFNLIHGILEKETLLFLPYLYHILLPWQRIQQQDVLLKLLDFTSEMIRTRFPHLRPVQHSLTLLHGMSVDERSNCSTRVFQCLLNRLQIVFLDDMPDESQLREAAKMLCPSGPLNSCQSPSNPDNYRQTSLAVRLLYQDADRLRNRSRCVTSTSRELWAHRVVQESMNVSISSHSLGD